MAVTIKDIAAAANVSKATVSYVINGKPGVGEETRRKVLRIMEELNYRPSALARGLAGQGTQMLGLVIPDITDMFYADIIRGVEAKANEFGYVLNLCTTRAIREKEYAVVDMLTDGRIDGVILMTYFLDEEFFDELKKRGVPFVVIDNPTVGDSIYSIAVDNEEVGYLATRHLLELGHQRIAFVHGASVGAHTSEERFTGYYRALRDYGIEFREEYLERGEFRRDGGYKAAKTLLRMDPRPTAIFAANDQMALGALSAAAESGLQVPRDLSLIGVDDIEAVAVVDPPLTTIKQPTYEIGSLAVETLLELHKGNKPAPRKRLLRPTLVVRDSCAAV